MDTHSISFSIMLFYLQSNSPMQWESITGQTYRVVFMILHITKKIFQNKITILSIYVSPVNETSFIFDCLLQVGGNWFQDPSSKHVSVELPNIDAPTWHENTAVVFEPSDDRYILAPGGMVKDWHVAEI